MKNIVAFLFVLFVALSSSGQSFQESMQTIMSDNDILGVSVVTLCGGEVDQTFHDGLARVNGSVATNSNTKYRIASVSKLVTAIGLMKLYDQGLFQLDDDVSAALGFSSKLSDSVANVRESPSPANATMKENGNVLAIVHTSKEMQDPKRQKEPSRIDTSLF